MTGPVLVSEPVEPPRRSLQLHSRPELRGRRGRPGLTAAPPLLPGGGEPGTRSLGTCSAVALFSKKVGKQFFVCQ